MELECAQCGRKFFWLAKQESDTPPTYHSETCRKAASEARRKVGLQTDGGENFYCPTPDKVRHETWTSAGQVIDKVDQTMSAYRCLCGWIHVGHAYF